MSVNKKVIKVEDLRVYFHTKKGDSKAVDGNHFTMYENETLAIVGESGCGKSVTAMSILGLVSEPLPPSSSTSVCPFISVQTVRQPAGLLKSF